MDKFFAIHQVCQSRGPSRSTVLRHEAVEKDCRLSATAEPLFLTHKRTEYLEGKFADAPGDFICCVPSACPGLGGAHRGVMGSAADLSLFTAGYILPL